MTTSIGWDDPRKPGELLWPEQFGPAEVTGLKRDLGSYGYAGQYQQRPSPASGGMIKPAWFPRWRSAGADDAIELLARRAGEAPRRLLPAHGLRYLTVDLAVSTKTTADYTVIMAFAMWDRDVAVMDLRRERLEGPDIFPAIKTLATRWLVDWAAIESVAFQLSMVQEARRGGLMVKELEADRDKVSRALAAVPLMEEGRIWLPENAPWVPGLESELAAFPLGAHDDQVDALVYGALLAQRYAGAGTPRGATPKAEQLTDERDRPAPPMSGFGPDRSPFDR